MPIVEIPISEPTEPDVWWNYHKTGCSRLGRRFALRSGDAQRGRDDLAETAEEVRKWLIKAQSERAAVRPVGGAWSPSNIQVPPDGGWMLNTRRYNRCFRLASSDFARPNADAKPFLLVQAGVQIDEINDKLESDAIGRSLRSTGASNGQTLAGACATGTHGSVLDAGGIQDHVRALQIVTPGGIYWIEPADGLMSEPFIAETGSRPLKDDQAFEAALVHVGSLGVVTALVIETAPRFLLRAVLKLIDFREEDLAMLARGEYGAFSSKHGPTKGADDIDYGDPYFIMVIANPYAPYTRKAVVRFLYKSQGEVPCLPAKSPAQLGAGYDAFSMLGWVFRNFAWGRSWLLQIIMTAAVKFGNPTDPNVCGTWGQTTETHKPLAEIFTGSLFVDRNRLVEAFETARKAFTEAGGATAITLRFTKGRHGLLSPARWPDTAGLDCDGPDSDETKAAFRAIWDALDREGIEFTRHWGKYNLLSPERVAQDYGDDFREWKRWRDRLLPGEADRRLFSAPALTAIGLTD